MRQIKKQIEHRASSIEYRENGSALILAIVLTSLLAIVGVIFLLSSRVDSVATSSISDNKDLWLAVDSVVAKISEELTRDVPRTDANGVPIEEYYDYPDGLNPWLACLEPYYKIDTNDYCWRQISDIYGDLYPISQNMIAKILRDYNDTFRVYTAADADGDGVSDSMWVQLRDKTSAKGKPIFAAIRIIDNGGMLNVNTGFKFDPGSSVGSTQLDINLVALSWRGFNPTAQSRLDNYRCGIEPSYLYEPNVIWRYGNPAGAYTPFDISDELKLRNRYIINFNLMTSRIEELWERGFDGPPYVPRNAADHDISDPYDWFWIAYNSYPVPCPDPCIYAYRHIATTYNLDRIINPNGGKMFNVNSAADGNIYDVCDAIRAALDPNIFPDATVAQITANLIDYLDGPATDPNNNVTVVYDSIAVPHFGFEQPCIYISEIVQSFFQPDANDPNNPTSLQKSFAIELYKPYPEDPIPGPNDWRILIFDPNFGNEYFSVYWTESGPFHVLKIDDYNRIEVNVTDYATSNPKPPNGAIGVDANVILNWPVFAGATSYNVYFGTDFSTVYNATPADANVFKGTFPASITTFDPPGALANNTTFYWRIDPVTAADIVKGHVLRFTVSDSAPPPTPIEFTRLSAIEIQRWISDPCFLNWITVDRVDFSTADINASVWLKPTVFDPNNPSIKAAVNSFQRDIFPNKPIRRLWDLNFSRITEPSLGGYNKYFDSSTAVIQAHPANHIFTNIGEFGQIFFAPTYRYGGMGPDFTVSVTEPEMRINLADSNYQQVFKYLTVFDPTSDKLDNDGDGHIDELDEPNTPELKIKGRININTAPWFVIAQLPWVSQRIGDPNADYRLARSITTYRDTVKVPRGFRSTGELMQVGVYDPNLFYYATDVTDLNSLPDLTPADGAANDFEERDVIFARISNLVTVRSDVFTAYILVRIGENGPQKRVVAILDRSGVYPTAGGYSGKVKIVAIQPVPDPR